MAKEPTSPATQPESATPPAAASKPSRKKAEHEYIGASGSVVDTQEEAAGCSYTDVSTGKSASFVIPGGKAGSVQTMLAAFGLKTLFTNTASGARQQRLKGADTVADVDAIVARMSELKDGQWDNPAAGPTGPRYDLDILATVATEVISKASGKKQDISKVREKLETDLKYRRGLTGHPDVKAAYLKAAKIEPAKPADLASFAM